MDAITRWLSPFFPSWAARRVYAQAQLARASRYYEAVQPSSQRPRRGNGASADAVMEKARGNPREYARWLDENHDLAIGVLDDLVTNIVGCGAGIEPMVTRKGEPVTDLNLQLRALWRGFWQSPEATGELHGAEVERLVCRSWLRDGEVLAQHVNRANPGSTIPYSIELLEADFLPYDLVDGKNRITHGVQKDGWGRPIGYYLLKTHPGGHLPGPSLETVFKPAADMIHLKLVRRLHQTRGISVFHGVFTRLDDIKDYEESERIAARVAAALTAYIKRDASLGDVVTASADGESRSFEMSPGLIFDGLSPGEDVGVIDSKRPNPNLETFRNGQLRGIAAGTGTRFSSIAKNYNGTYSAQRQELVETVMHYRRMFDYLRARFYMPIWRRFVEAARLSGQLRIPANIDMDSLYSPEIRPPQMPWIDPKKEMEAYQIMVEQGFRSRPQIIRDLGDDPAMVDKLLASDEFDARPSEQEPASQPADNDSMDEAA